MFTAVATVASSLLMMRQRSRVLTLSISLLLVFLDSVCSPSRTIVGVMIGCRYSFLLLNSLKTSGESKTLYIRSKSQGH